MTRRPGASPRARPAGRRAARGRTRAGRGDGRSARELDHPLDGSVVASVVPTELDQRVDDDAVRRRRSPANASTAASPVSSASANSCLPSWRPPSPTSDEGVVGRELEGVPEGGLGRGVERRIGGLADPLEEGEAEVALRGRRRPGRPRLGAVERRRSGPGSAEVDAVGDGVPAVARSRWRLAAPPTVARSSTRTGAATESPRAQPADHAGRAARGRVEAARPRRSWPWIRAAVAGRMTRERR